MTSTCLLISTWNRTPLLAKNFERLATLTVPDEILVVDDGGCDGCEQLCDRARAEWGLPVRYLYNHRPYQAMCSQAKNAGIKHTDAELVITSEPEMIFETDVIGQMLAQHEHDRQWGIKQFINVGRIRHEQPPGTRCRCCGQLKHETVNWQAMWVTLFRREWLLHVNGWDEDFVTPWGWDDVDLGSRLRICGIGQFNSMDMVATHQWHPVQFWSQVENEAYFKSKGFDGAERPDHPNLKANQDHPWGVLIPRP